MDSVRGSMEWTSSAVFRIASVRGSSGHRRGPRVPPRPNSGVEQYPSLAASADGRRLVATVSRSEARLWRVPIGGRVMEESDTTAVPLSTATGVSPRIGPGYVVYRAPKAGTDGLWKLPREGAATELWDGRNGRAIGGGGVVAPRPGAR